MDRHVQYESRVRLQLDKGDPRLLIGSGATGRSTETVAATPRVREASLPVYLLFLDESGSPGDQSFAVGGIAVRADNWGVLRERWHGAMTEHNWPLDKEAKWHGALTGEVPPALADALFAAIASAPVTCYTVILRPTAGRKLESELFADDESTYATAIKFLAERFELFLEREDSYGAIVLDSRRRELDDRTRRFFERIQRDGTEYLAFNRIIDGLLLGPSHFSVGLQVADLIVGTTLKAQRAPGDATRWFKQLEPCFAHHPDTGVLEGVGLKIYPPKVTAGEPQPRKLFG